MSILYQYQQIEPRDKWANDRKKEEKVNKHRLSEKGQKFNQSISTFCCGNKILSVCWCDAVWGVTFNFGWWKWKDSEGKHEKYSLSLKRKRVHEAWKIILGCQICFSWGRKLICKFCHKGVSSNFEVILMKNMFWSSWCKNHVGALGESWLTYLKLFFLLEKSSTSWISKIFIENVWTRTEF